SAPNALLSASVSCNGVNSSEDINLTFRLPSGLRLSKSYAYPTNSLADPYDKSNISISELLNPCNPNVKNLYRFVGSSIQEVSFTKGDTIGVGKVVFLLVNSSMTNGRNALNNGKGTLKLSSWSCGIPP